MLSNREIVQIVDAEFESSAGHDGGEISKERAKALDYYLSKKLGNEVEGQSQVVTSDVSDVVDSVMPSLLRLFTIDENLVNFEPVGVEDAPMARQESDYVNYVFFKLQDAFTLLYTWFFDALVQKNGIVKCWFDESEVVTEESYANLSEDELLELLQDEELEVVERDQHLDELEQTLHDVTFKRTAKKGRIRVENVPPEEFRISADARSVNPSEARMVGQERDISRADLIAMGFSKDLVFSLPAVNQSWESEEEISRRDKDDDDANPQLKASNELVRIRECYIKLDMEENGKTETREIMISGNQVLLNEAADRQPFHVVCPQPLPHKFHGRALAEKVMDVQDVNTTLVRQMLDNYYHTNNPGHAVNELSIGDDTIDDLLTTKIGSIKRFRGDPNTAHKSLTVPFVAGNAFTALEYFDKVKRDRTGVQADSEGLSPEQLKNIQQSVLTQANDLSRMKVETIARIFAETGIKSLFLHIHELIRKYQDKEEVIALRGEWIPVKPTEWKDRHNVTVNIGLGIGSKEAKLMHLQAIWEKQAAMADAGLMGLGVTPDNLFNTASEIVKNAGLKEPRRYFNDPQGQMAPPPSSEAMQLQQQQMQIAQRQQQLDAAELQLKEMKLMLDNKFKELDALQDKTEHSDKMLIEIEKLKNELVAIEAKSETEARKLRESIGPILNFDPSAGQLNAAN